MWWVTPVAVFDVGELQLTESMSTNRSTSVAEAAAQQPERGDQVPKVPNFEYWLETTVDPDKQKYRIIFKISQKFDVTTFNLQAFEQLRNYQGASISANIFTDYQNYLISQTITFHA